MPGLAWVGARVWDGVAAGVVVGEGADAEADDAPAARVEGEAGAAGGGPATQPEAAAVTASAVMTDRSAFSGAVPMGTGIGLQGRKKGVVSRSGAVSIGPCHTGLRRGDQRPP